MRCTSYAVDVGLGHMTCIGQWDVSGSDRLGGCSSCILARTGREMCPDRSLVRGG